VHGTIAKPLDWAAIKLAALSVHRNAGGRGQAKEVEALLREPSFFGDFVTAPEDFQLKRRAFRFTSPVVSPWKRNNTVHGRFFPVAGTFPEHPTVILLHGWNQELGYRTLFPYLARRLNAAGVNAVMMELPYHRQRKPRGRGAIRNFIADDLRHVAMATHQALADARALVAWLEKEGCREIGVWGISLGAWLGGLLACVEARLKFAVLMTPVARMDRVIAELEFCEPIRRSLGGAKVRLEPLNLVSHRPKMSPENILVVASEHDLFAPVETVEELAVEWGNPVLWRMRHGHISVMMSAPVMERTVKWIARRKEAAN
jgi:dienelactone hydrolase